MVEKGRTTRSKRVSWAPGRNLCQVRLFLSEDAPCQSGFDTQDHLQEKGPWIKHASVGPSSDDSPLPPGFESVYNQNRPKTDVSKIPLIPWKCPPMIELNREWYVVSGEESQEIAKQNQRNFGVLEAIYPRQSTIPPNPSISVEAQESHFDESWTRLVPLTAAEEDDLSDPSDSQPVQSETTPIQSDQPNSVWHPIGPPPAHSAPGNAVASPALSDTSLLLSRLGAHADVAAATAAAITALTRSTEQGNLIDQELLIKILSDPSLIEKLLLDNRNSGPAQPTTSVTAMSAPLLPPSPPLPHTPQLFNNVNEPNLRPSQPMMPTTISGPLPPLPPPPLQHNQPLFNTTSNTDSNPRPPQPIVTSTVSAPLPPPPPRHSIIHSFTNTRPNMVAPVTTPLPPPQIITSRPSPSVIAAKDASYYKSLIQQHGGEIVGRTNPGVTETGAGTVSFKGQQHVVLGTGNSTKSKIQKTCVYFNTPKGCRNGDGCLFLHESSVGSRDERAKKRVKLDNSIAGRI